MINLKELWVAEYSATQYCFHIDLLEQSLMKNTRMIAKKANNDYLMFGIFETHEEASMACALMRKIQQEHGSNKCRTDSKTSSDD